MSVHRVWLLGVVMVLAPGLPIDVQGNQIPKAKALSKLPGFSAKDLRGRVRKQTELAGRGGVIFFYCGCEPCHDCARQWGQIQRGNAVPPDAVGRPARSMIFYSGEVDAARAFLTETGLDAEVTAVVADPMMKTARKFGAGSCPRAFVADRNGKICYTNISVDDRPEGGKPAVIISRVVQALRDALPSATSREAKRVRAKKPSRSRFE